MLAVPSEIQRAAAVIRSGGVVAYPTESCFGLGCDPSNREAVRRILRMKRRPASKGLILIGANIAQFRPFLRPLTVNQKCTLSKSWPGPVSWLVPVRTGLRLLSGNHDTLAVRIPAHLVARQLSLAAGMAIVSTSANRAQRPAATTARDVRRIFGNEVDYILEGRIGGSAKPSEIRDLASGRVIRPGA